MQAVNKALLEWSTEKTRRLFSSISETAAPCVFISYQRDDEKYAELVADYILGKGIDVYFDKYDSSLRLTNETSNPTAVTASIRKGLQFSTHMLVLISQNTSKSYWVPFEIGYSYDKMDTNQKILKHKNVSLNDLPAYVKTREIYTASSQLDTFLSSIFKNNNLILEKINGTNSYVKNFSQFSGSHPLNNVLN